MSYLEERVKGMEALMSHIDADIRQRADTDRPFSHMRWAHYYFKRRNEHFARERAFYNHVIQALRTFGRAVGDDRVVQTAEETAGLLHEATVAEPLKKGWIFRPPGGLVELAVEFRKHSQRQQALNDMIGVALGLVLGSSVSISGESMPSRSAWTYSWQPRLALADINKHLAQQAAAEDQILSYLKMIASQCTTG